MLRKTIIISAVFMMLHALATPGWLGLEVLS